MSEWSEEGGEMWDRMVRRMEVGRVRRLGVGDVVVVVVVVVGAMMGD